MMTTSFYQRFAALSRKHSALCVGVDPFPELLAAWGLPLTAAGLKTFCDIVMEAVDGNVAVIKPQSAFFEQFGYAGIEVLAGLLGEIRKQKCLSILDCKRGDIGTTLNAYAHAYLDRASPLHADAITLSPYLGIDALKPAFERAVAENAAIFVVVRSSNPEGKVLQNALLRDGRTVADYLADEITAFNAQIDGGGDLGAVQPIGAVIGATLSAEEIATVARLPQSMILAPGIGAQGASVQQFALDFAPYLSRAIPSVSRAILQHGPDVQALKKAIQGFQSALMRIDAH